MSPAPKTSPFATCAWLLLLLCAMTMEIRAAPVLKCVDADGHIAFQATPCAAGQRQSEVAIDPAPAPGVAPVYAVPKAPARTNRAPRRSVSRAKPAMSFECRASDGQVFYRHTSCPGSVASDGRGSSRRGRTWSRSGATTRAAGSSTRIPRAEACRRIHAGGSSVRRGHEHDEDVSAYEHNLGRDPCR
jgi:hypothetical protein